jgi:hypothetical protein
MDVVVNRVKVGTDLPVRKRFPTEGLALGNEDVSHIPLHHQIIPWAMKKSFDVTHRAVNRLDWRLIKVNRAGETSGVCTRPPCVALFRFICFKFKENPSVGTVLALLASHPC